MVPWIFVCYVLIYINTLYSYIMYYVQCECELNWFELGWLIPIFVAFVHLRENDWKTTTNTENCCQRKLNLNRPELSINLIIPIAELNRQRTGNNWLGTITVSQSDDWYIARVWPNPRIVKGLCPCKTRIHASIHSFFHPPVYHSSRIYRDVCIRNTSGLFSKLAKHDVPPFLIPKCNKTNLVIVLKGPMCVPCIYSFDCKWMAYSGNRYKSSTSK